MIIAQNITELKNALNFSQLRLLVPTMGALHEGHISLVDKARKTARTSGQVIVSIFVNPTQFDRKEDLDNYPNTLDADIEKCKTAGVDVVFIPNPEEMYIKNRSISLIETSLSRTLCGKTRPGHFDGVCIVCTKLFNLTQATHAVFGEKDFQQLAIIQRLVRDLNIPIEIIPGKTMREASGLAMSSRNLRLSDTARKEASVIFKTLSLSRQQALNGETSSVTLIQQAADTITSTASTPTIDYLEIVDAENLQPLECLENKNAVMALAVFFEGVRLIDHIDLH